MAGKENNRLIVVTGPTAAGKTSFASALADRIGGEIISADSRQVYRGMDLATGKDVEDYVVEGRQVPYHLVDILDPGYEYNVFEFQKDFLKAFEDIVSRTKVPVMCGGTGMYIESVLKGYRLEKVQKNETLRKELSGKSMDELRSLLGSFKVPHNITDTQDRDRLIRAIEIQKHDRGLGHPDRSFPDFKSTVFGIRFDREDLRKRITERLKLRLDKGMVDEVKVLLEQGLRPEQLTFYGLEYRYLTRYAIGEITYDEMFRLLNTAIHQFAKRQMTWFRKMERDGTVIHWIDGRLSMDEKLSLALTRL